jgi:hypothetical protein
MYIIEFKMVNLLPALGCESLKPIFSGLGLGAIGGGDVRLAICCGVTSSPGGDEPSRLMGGRPTGGCTGVDRPEPAKLGGEEESRCRMGMRLAELGRRRFSGSSSVMLCSHGGRTAASEERNMS